MDRWAGKTAMITGAASGIGKAIADAFLKERVDVFALDVDNEKLAAACRDWERLKSCGKYRAMRCDISKKSDLDAAFDTIRTTWNGGVDIMINNAGVVNYTRVIESQRETFEMLLNINVVAVAECTQLAVSSMRQRKVEGHIFNINSVLGHEIPSGFLSEIDGCNGWNLYPACKHGTVALTHTVRRELAAIKAPIRITSISPGIVRTDIAKHAGPVVEVLKNMPALEPTDVADAVIYALGTRPEVQLIAVNKRENQVFLGETDSKKENQKAKVSRWYKNFHEVE